MTTKLAFITGITWQDGSYLSELLLDKGYNVFGIVRRTSLLFSHTRIEHIRDKLNLSYGDMTDSTGLSNFIHNIIQTHPEFEVFEIYNLAAQSHVAISFEIPEYTNDVDGAGVLRILEVIRTLPSSIKSKIRFYQAGTSEMGHAKDYVVGMWLMLQQPARRVATARRFRPRIRKNADHPHIRREGIRVQRHRYRMEWQRRRWSRQRRINGYNSSKNKREIFPSMWGRIFIRRRDKSAGKGRLDVSIWYAG